MKGKAAVLLDVGGPFEIREYPLPDVEPGAILARVIMSPVCGSDVHVFKGEHALQKISKGNPRLLGHEAIARVFRLGRDVKTDYLGRPLREGDRITASIIQPCGQCSTCLSGLAQCLNRFRFKTSPEEFPHFSGTFAEYYYIRPGQWVYKVPEGLSDEAVAPVNCALSTVTYALSQVGIGFGASIVIQGAGGLGISAAALSKDMGAAHVIVVEKNLERLKVARDFGADEVIGMEQYPSAEERVAKVRELTGGRGVELVIELTGNPDGIPEGMKMLGPGGTYLLVGMVSGKITFKGEMDSSEFVFQSKKLWGCASYRPWVIPKVFDFLLRTKDRYPFDKLISHKFGLGEIERAMKLADEGKVTRAAIVP